MPDANFYCFEEPDCDDSDYDRKIEKEIKDIDRLINDTLIDFGKSFIQLNKDEAQILPVVRNHENSTLVSLMRNIIFKI